MGMRKLLDKIRNFFGAPPGLMQRVDFISEVLTAHEAKMDAFLGKQQDLLKDLAKVIEKNASLPGRTFPIPIAGHPFDVSLNPRLFDALLSAAALDPESAKSASEGLLAADPFAINKGVYKRHAPKDMLERLRLFCRDPGFVYRMHLVDLLKLQAASSAEHQLLNNVFEKASQTGPLPSSPLNVEADNTDQTGSLVNIPLFWGEDLWFPAGDLLAGHFKQDHFFEEGLTLFLLFNLDRKSVFIDVGAHVGYYTRLAGMLLDSPSQIHSFEPTGAVYAVLQQNCADLPGVTLNNKAVWSQSGEIAFTDMGEHLAAFNSALPPRLSESYLKSAQPKQIKVPAVSLDDYCVEKGIAPDLIKIDAESAEAEILKGMQNVLDEARPVVTIEVGDYEVSGASSSRELVETIISHGYDALEYSQGQIRRHEPKTSYEYDNLFFVPRVG
jgi:FkbM family methyltransferase